jgi:DNA polymerase-3 subunit epsilon
MNILRPGTALALPQAIEETSAIENWPWLAIAPIGCAGFCALRLAQRLLDPVPAGNCKLQTLRLRLPERGAHTALGDVGTVADLFATVLRPIAEQRGLETWEQLATDAAEEWVPSRIAFGQHKGRSIAEARTDAGLRRWLDGLAQSANARNARMGRWSLRKRRNPRGSSPGSARATRLPWPSRARAWCFT